MEYRIISIDIVYCFEVNGIKTGRSLVSLGIINALFGVVAEAGAVCTGINNKLVKVNVTGRSLISFGMTGVLFGVVAEAGAVCTGRSKKSGFSSNRPCFRPPL